MTTNIKRRLIIVIICFTIGFSIGTITGKFMSYKERINKLENQIIEQADEIENYKNDIIKLRKALKE